MARRASRRALWIAALAAVVLAGCVKPAPPPPPPPPPPPEPPASVAGCGSNETPTPTNPVDYVAVVDEPGSGPPTVETFTATSEAEKDAKVAALDDRGTVVAVDEDVPVAALVTQGDDPNFALPGSYGLSSSGFTTAWANGFDGTGVRIAILDTGVTETHEDLGSAKVVQGIDYWSGSDDLPAGDSNYARIDANGHGTHVAGIAAGADNTVGGVGGAPGATIVPVRVLGPQGSGSSSAVVTGILWAADPSQGDADVISMSLGGDSCASGEQAAVDYAEGQGVVVVAAAGNSNVNVPIYPAGFEGEVIAVGATTSTNAKASYSNYGTPFVDIGAPGSSILSAYKPGPNTYATLSGTSMATPFVSAAVALVLQHCPAIINGAAGGASRADKVLGLLQSTASPQVLGLGAKLLQAGAATSAACPA